jgi:hypothetical protein
MTKLEKAARSFFVLAQISRLLKLAHDQQLQWSYEITANTVDDPEGKPERNQDGSPKFTGGYEIRVTIHPPTGAPGVSQASEEPALY